MKKKFFKIVIILLIFIVAIIGSYIVTYSIDKFKNQDKMAIIDVLFDDTDYYLMPNNEVLDSDKALLEWPYKFLVSNTGNETGLYQIIILDNELNDINRDNLSYILYQDEKEVAKGELKNLNNDVLYETNIKKDTEQRYELYIYKSSEDDGSVYQYSIHLNAILEGGPGF